MQSHQSLTASHPTQATSSPPPSLRCRYQHTSRAGQALRYFASPGSRFCKYHPRDERCDANDALASELAEAADDLSYPEDVKCAMAKIFHTLVQHRISAKEAGVLCYIAQTILHSHRAVAYQENLDAEAAAAEEAALPTQNFSWDLPPSEQDDRLPPTKHADSATAEPEDSSATSVVADPSTKVADSVSSFCTFRTSASSTLPAPIVTEPAPPPKPPDCYNHFYPHDPTLPPGAQDPAKPFLPSCKRSLAAGSAAFIFAACTATNAADDSAG